MTSSRARRSGLRRTSRPRHPRKTPRGGRGRVQRIPSRHCLPKIVEIDSMGSFVAHRRIVDQVAISARYAGKKGKGRLSHFSHLKSNFIYLTIIFNF